MPTIRFGVPIRLAFKDKVDQLMSNYDVSENIDSSVRNFTKILTTAAVTHIGQTTATNKTRSVPWWNPKCEAAVKECKKALNKYRKNRTTDNLIAFKQKKAVARHTLKQSKKKIHGENTCQRSQVTPHLMRFGIK